jgi:hypothetical protein
VRAGANLEDREALARLKAECSADFSSAEAVARMAFLSLRKVHPEITEARAASLVDFASAIVVQSVLDQMTFPQQDQDADLFLTDDEKKTADGEG